MADATLVDGQANRRLGDSELTMETGELLERLAGTLRSDIAPAVGDEFAKTQAYMASVIVAKVAKQVALAPEHGVAERTDVAALLEQLTPILGDAPGPVSAAMSEVTTVAEVGPVIEALYEWGTDRPAAKEALSLIRVQLRRDIDRRMEIAS